MPSSRACEQLRRRCLTSRNSTDICSRTWGPVELISKRHAARLPAKGNDPSPVSLATYSGICTPPVSFNLWPVLGSYLPGSVSIGIARSSCPSFSSARTVRPADSRCVRYSFVLAQSGSAGTGRLATVFWWLSDLRDGMTSGLVLQSVAPA